jgi:hypothetical protein
MTERWLPVPGYEGIYEVSNFGWIRRTFPGKGTWIGRTIRGARSSGYFVLSLRKNQRTERRLLHEIVAEVFIGPRPEGAEVNHIDGNKRNPVVWNLEYLSRSENAKHAVRTGLIRSGENSPVSILKNAQVEAIRAEPRPVSVQRKRELAKRYGVGFWTINNVLYRKSYRTAQQEMDMSLEVGKWIADIECLNCGKIKEGVNVTCKAGTFTGPLCASCLFREAKKRTNNEAKKPQSANGLFTQ